MFRLTVILACTVAVLAPVVAGELRPYKHPDLDLQFTAEDGWVHRPRPGDEGTHERVDPDTGIHVLMWHTTTEQDAHRYLRKMAGMMDLAAGAEPRPRTVGGREAWVVERMGTVERMSVQTTLAVVPSGKSSERPFENILYILQLWCPAEDRARLADRMSRLLDSVRVTDCLVLDGCSHRLYPATTERPPDLPSPFTTGDGETYVTIRTREGRYALVPVTVENGAPNDYPRGEWDKGRQLEVDAEDFPTLAATGVHSEAELSRTTSITGRPVAEITQDARPGEASGSGFVAEDEDVLEVIRADNRTVTDLGLTHPQLARPLFEVFNLILRDLELYRRGRLPAYNIATVLYGRQEIHIDAEGGKGWQESIFADEVRGYWSIRIRRDPTFLEERYLRRHYGHLDSDRLAELTEMLTSIRFSEMVPFYITRYGFYEGHTEYRADPLAIASLFGLENLEGLDVAVRGDLYGALSERF